MITQSLLKEFLHYNHETGIFTWVKRPCNRMKIGSIAGCIHYLGYMHITIKNKKYTAHHLASLYMRGHFPKNQFDHIDGNKLNNSWKNLRDVTNSENQQNLRAPKSTNKSGFLGVHLNKRTGKFVSQITLNRELICLGCFEKAEDAYHAYIKAKRKLHPFSMI